MCYSINSVHFGRSQGFSHENSDIHGPLYTTLLLSVVFHHSLVQGIERLASSWYLFPNLCTLHSWVWPPMQPSVGCGVLLFRLRGRTKKLLLLTSSAGCCSIPITLPPRRAKRSDHNNLTLWTDEPNMTQGTWSALMMFFLLTGSWHGKDLLRQTCPLLWTWTWASSVHIFCLSLNTIISSHSIAFSLPQEPFFLAII